MVLALRIVTWPFRLLAHVLRRLAQPFVRRVDTSSRLGSLINAAASAMATQRGLLLIIGTALVVISLVVHGLVLVLLVTAHDFSGNLYWLCVPFALLHTGVLVGFTGAMLATPLGQGYRDR